MTLVSTRSRWRELANLEGLISEATGVKLAELAAAVPNTQTVVNIGVFKGKSTCYLAEGSALGGRATVLAIDPWDLPGNPDGKHHYHGALDKFVEQLAQVGLEWAVWAIKEFSAVVAGWNPDIVGPVGLLFIDGDHEYESVREDWNAWYPHLAPGAVVAFDDYQTPKNPGVGRFVKELQGTRPQDQWEIQQPLAICRVGEPR